MVYITLFMDGCRFKMLTQSLLPSLTLLMFIYINKLSLKFS